MMEWIVTKDLINTQDGDTQKVNVGRKDYGTLLLEKGSPQAFQDHIAQLPYEFQLLDDDGILYYEGKCGDLAEASEQKAFEPLDWAMADVGCTEMLYRKLGEKEWAVL